MDWKERYIVLADLVNKMHGKHSWCGETHVQKTAYFMQELTGVPLEFDFILYLHGPYSFDLHDEILAMRARGVLDIDVKRPPYGPSLVLTDFGKRVHKNYHEFRDRFAERVDWIARHFADKTVVQLEKLGTAYYVTRKQGMEGKSVEERARHLHELKPHVSLLEAREALETMDGRIDEVKNIQWSGMAVVGGGV